MDPAHIAVGHRLAAIALVALEDTLAVVVGVTIACTAFAWLGGCASADAIVVQVAWIIAVVIVSLRILLIMMTSAHGLLFSVALKALESRLTVIVVVAVALAHGAWAVPMASVDAFVGQLHACISQITEVIVGDIIHSAEGAPRHLCLAVALEAFE